MLKNCAHHEDTPSSFPAIEKIMAEARLDLRPVNRRPLVKDRGGKTRHYGADGEKRDGREGYNSDSINIYFSSIKRYKLLTARDEFELAGKVAKGDASAREKMIQANLRLVVNIAKKYINRGLPLQDLIEEGNIGLIKSVERFRTSKGCKFSTYATYWIKQSIDRAVANQANTVRLPIHITTDLSKISRATRDLTMFLSREPNTSEVSAKTGLSGRYVKKLEMINRKSYSLEATVSEEGEQSLLDKLVDEKIPSQLDFIRDSTRVEIINAWLELLDANERKIIRLRFGLGGTEPQTLEAVGRSFGITRERVRQIEAKAISKLKKFVDETHITYSDV